MSFAQNFKCIKENRGLSNYLIAKKMHCSQTTIANWLEGVSVPSMDKIQILADILHTDISDFLDKEQKNKSLSEKDKLLSEIIDSLQNCSEAEKEIVLKHIKDIKSLRNK